MLRPARHQRGVAKEMNVGPDVLDQVVMDNDVVCEPVELTRCVHTRGAHRAVGLNRWNEAQ